MRAADLVVIRLDGRILGGFQHGWAKMIPPDAQRAMSKRAGSTVVEVKGSHAVYVSQPQAVALLIEKAARGALVAGKEQAAADALAAAT